MSHKFHYSQKVQVNAAFHFNISEMNPQLKAVSVIKSAPEGAAIPCVGVAVTVALDYWDLLE